MNIQDAVARLAERHGTLATRPSGVVMSLSRSGALVDPRRPPNRYARLRLVDVAAEDWEVLPVEQYAATLEGAAASSQPAE